MKKKINFLIAISAMVFVGSILQASVVAVASYPKAFIPFWSEQRGGYETTLLNVEHIIRVVPIFDAEDIESTSNRVENAIHLEVHLSDGKVIVVDEDFKEFYTRIRKAGN